MLVQGSTTVMNADVKGQVSQWKEDSPLDFHYHVSITALSLHFVVIASR